MSALLPSDDLAPCPFCGGKATPDVEDNGSGTFWIVCDNVSEGCGCEGPYQHSEAEAIAAWNRRTAPVGEAVSWQYRYKRDRGNSLWSAWGDHSSTLASYSDYIEEKRPLYTAPAPALPTQEDVARAVEALRPFVEALKRVDRGGPDNACFIGSQLTLGDLRDAEAAILALMGQTGDGWSDAFGKHRGWSLSFDGKIFCEDDNPDLWTVYAETGSINDRECRVIGRGKTPLEAINAALRRALPAPPAKEGR